VIIFGKFWLLFRFPVIQKESGAHNRRHCGQF